ncbi:glycoside hydrolase family 16 protein [Croceicoccus ponticola]|uniref:Glycoside hydrolase family 16 protein n=1 Tax=Croceicoccus ponticola TaxID=2217664 RepID=A0A437H151_9SPHN|nr:glycoside hydrolase family 16 protein [Croceicoccus ponticola]RVQ69338.1 glycoside hydrolase family 16 protein [Croceicoccus ponticola]
MRFLLSGLVLALSACATVPEPDPAWSLVWSDEFDGEGIDGAKWGFDVDCWGGGNNERQCYTDRQKNARVEDSKLVIEAHRETLTGPALPEDQRTAANAGDTATKPFTSARLVSRGKAAWKYARIEVRAELPQGQGTWPAIWMLPERNTYGAWPLSGEIDVLEAVNLGVACTACPDGIESTILGTLHFGNARPDNRHKGEEMPYPPVLSGFHTYAVDWRQDRMVWTVDGKVFATRTADEWFTGARPDDPFAPFDHPFHLILNLAIGGGLPEGRGTGGVDDTEFPKRMRIDWVRVWQCEADPATAAACER